MTIKAFLKAVLCMVLIHPPSFISAQTGCLDPNPIQITTPCGTQLDVCLDNYVLEPGQQMIVMNVFSNDLELFDPCASKIITTIGPNDGQVFRISDLTQEDLDNFNISNVNLSSFKASYDPCLHVYIASSANGVISDQYEYETYVSDNCLDPEFSNYCDDGDPNSIKGKIWTMYVQYLGAVPADIDVSGGAGNNSQFLQSFSNVQPGGYFFVDGTGLSKNSEWVFSIDRAGSITDVSVHTSCSFQIFGTPHPVGENFEDLPTVEDLILPVSGCVDESATGGATGPRGTCITTAPARRNNINTREEISTQSTDTTVVTIVRNTILPISLSEFSVHDQSEANVIQWSIESAKDEFEMILEKSNDGLTFHAIKSFFNIALQTYTVYDKDISHKDHYYRIKSVSINGDINYSSVKYIEREIESTITIFPNPTNGVIEISLLSNNIDHVSLINIFDMAGRKIQTLNLNATSKRLDLKSMGLSSGVYILEANSKNGLRKIDRIIIQ